jgi:hypothetical protein
MSPGFSVDGRSASAMIATSDLRAACTAAAMSISFSYSVPGTYVTRAAPMRASNACSNVQAVRG